MKYFIAFSSLLLLMNNAYAGFFDSVFVTIHSDTITIWNTQADDNCAARFMFSVTNNNDTITVIEQDTSSTHTYCRCGLFDLSVSLTDLDVGNYYVNVFRRPWENPDTLMFIGSTTFIINIRGPSPYSTIPYQSNCGGVVSVKSEKQTTANEAVLLANYPNPFNPTTTIHYLIPTSEFVTLKVFSLLGLEVATLVNQRMSAGSYDTNFDGTELPSGMYFYHLTAGKSTVMGKMMVIR
jgi:hypothetical protein